MKKTVLLLLLCLLFTSCSSASSSDNVEPSSSDSSSIVYEDIKVKNIVFPASAELSLVSWKDYLYTLSHNDEYTISVYMYDLSDLDSSSKSRYVINKEENAKFWFASMDLLDASENAADTVSSTKELSNTGFTIFTLSRDDTSAFYATQVVDDIYYIIILSNGKMYNSFDGNSNKDISEYYDSFCDIVNSVKPV